MRKSLREQTPVVKTATSRVAWPGVAAGVLAGLLLVIAGCAQHKEASPAGPCEVQFKAKVPITLQNRKIIVSVDLNGRPVRMLVDTGANISTIAPHIAETLGGTYNRERLIQFGGTGGRLDAQHPLKLKTIQMGPLHWFDFELMVADVARADKRNDPDAVAGIMGTDLLRWYDVELDFQRGEMTFYQAPNCKGDFVPWEKPYQVLRSPQNRRKFFIVPVELNGRTVRALVDTGAGATFIDSSAAIAAGADRALLKQGKKISATGIGAIEMPARLYRFDELEIAGEKFRDRPLPVTQAPLSDGMDMLLGMDYWGQRKMWLSYQTGQVCIQKVSPPLGVNLPLIQ